MSELPRKPRVLLLSYVFPPDNLAGAARPYRFTKYLRQLGYPVTVVASGVGSEIHPTDGVYRLPGTLDGRPPVDGILGRAVDKLIRVAWGFPEDGITWIPRAIRFASRWGGESLVVFSTFPPLPTHLVAMALKRRYGWKWIADFRDPLLKNPVRTRLCVRWSDAVVERAILARADAAIATTDCLAQQWRNRYPQWTGKFHVLPNGFDPEQPVGPEPTPPRDHSVLAHVGFIYGQNHPGLLLKALSRLFRTGAITPDRLRVRFVGGAPSDCMQDSEDLRALTAAGMIEESSTRVPVEEAGRIRATADYLLVLDDIAGTTALRTPSKVFDYIRIGRPILASTTMGSPVERILASSGVSHVCLYPTLDDDELARRVLKFLSLPKDPVQPSELFQSTYDARRQASALAALISAIQ